MGVGHAHGSALRATTLLSAVLVSAQPVASLELGRTQSGSLEATLTDKSLQLQGVTPGGEVAYLGASLEEVHESWGSLRTYSGILTDEDSNGEVEFAPEAGISQASVWIAVDLGSGEVLGVSPDEFVRPLPEEIDLEVSGDLRSVATQRHSLELLLLRPGLGVWFGKGVGGGAADDGHDLDGKLRLGLSDLRSLRWGGPPPPATLRSGDRLLAIDPLQLDAINVGFQ